MHCKVLIAIPCRDTIDVDCFNSILNLIQTNQTVKHKDPVKSVTLLPYTIQGSILPRSREYSLREAIKQKATHILFLDSDMTFPAMLLHRWLYLNKPVIAANCVLRKIPSNTTARVFKIDAEGKEVHYAVKTTAEKAHKGVLEEVDAVGTGVMLIRLKDIADIPEPHFCMNWAPEINDYKGEDWYLCDLFRKHNIPIYVDHTVSWEVGHIGKFIHTHKLVQHADMYESLRQEALQANGEKAMGQENVGAEPKTDDGGNT